MIRRQAIQYLIGNVAQSLADGFPQPIDVVRIRSQERHNPIHHNAPHFSRGQLYM